VLGIETATSVCAAAVVHDGRVTAEGSFNERNVHAEKLLPLVDSILHEARMAMKDLDGIAVSIGPGSFTGLRIGLSVAKGLAYASSKPIVAVPTLQALAYRVVEAGGVGSSGFLLAALDARRDEVYCQLSTVEGRNISPLWDPRDMTVSALLHEIGDRAAMLTGDGSAKILSSADGDAQGNQLSFVGDDLSQCSAGSVALIGESLLAQQRTDDLATLEPRYIKDFFLKKQS
jgi:tRNA threonylcarbamoyladenosine biosynthesis protein TsaB